MNSPTCIWNNIPASPDEYVEFIDSFNYASGRVELSITADSQYAVYLGGKLAAFGQYSDYPYDKVCDTVDITEFCAKGENNLKIIVWYFGENSSTYFVGDALLAYEIKCDGKILTQSSENTLSRLSPCYLQHNCRLVTNQMGFGFSYDVRGEENNEGFSPGVIVKEDISLRPRPNKKLVLKSTVSAKEIKKLSDTEVLFDLGEEYCGFLELSVTSDEEQELTVSFGEHIADGRVRRLVGGRDFSHSLYLKKGENRYMNPFRRLACRYLEIASSSPVKVELIGIAPTDYPLTEKAAPTLTEKEKVIYDACVNTLKLCMHEHYEDCPWREQALYTMDSRNQMLCGYYAFGELQFPRSCLELISKDNREDGILSICYPAGNKLAIPSFSLHFFVEVAEYIKYSGDIDFAKGIYNKLLSILSVFDKNMKDGLYLPFPAGPKYWNFYEWSDGFSNGYGKHPGYPDLLLNGFMSLALKNMAYIAEKTGNKEEFSAKAEALNRRIYESFYCSDEGLFSNYLLEPSFGQLGNAVAILCGAADGELAEKIAEKLLNDTSLVPISLSMNCFKYDAWLKVDAQKYKEAIFADIDRIYTPMCEMGKTVWETELGESDFENAGSLCHGWSAMPIYYYNILK